MKGWLQALGLAALFAGTVVAHEVDLVRIERCCGSLEVHVLIEYQQ